MADKQAPHLTDKALADKRAREERQAAALRANLRRRKERTETPEGSGKDDAPAHG